MAQRPGESDDAYKVRVEIENMETDTAYKLKQIEAINQQLATETRRFVVSAILAAAALVGAGVALGRFIGYHQ